MSNHEHFVHNVNHFPPFGLSHHCVITCEVNFIPPKGDDTFVLKHRVDKADYDSMRSEMSKVKWDNLLNNDDHVNTYWDHIHSQIETLVNKYVPIKKCYKNVFKRPLTAPITLIDKVRLKRQAFKHYKKFPTVINYNIYARYRNQVKWESKKAKRLREYQVARDAKVNPKAFFRYAASKTKQTEKISNLKKEDGTLTENDQGKAEVLYDFFSSVFTNEDPNNIPPFKHPNLNVISHFTISDDDMKKSLKKP